MDRITGQLSDTRTRFLGTRPPKLFAANVKSQRSMLSLSSRPWLGYSDMGRYNLTPLSYEALDYASGTSKLFAMLPFESASSSSSAALTALHMLVVPAPPFGAAMPPWKHRNRQFLRMCSVGCAGFASEQCPEGFVAVAKNTLRILTLERLGETFNQQSCPLRYTPRRFVIHPDTRSVPYM